MFKRHRVHLRRRYVQYRGRTLALAAWTFSRRAAFLALGFLIAHQAHRFWATSPWFRVSRVEVDPAAPAAFAGRVGVAAGDPIFGFAAPALEARLEGEFPGLTEVRVRRGLDRAVSVAALWRQPVARVSDGAEGWRGVDAAGTVFPLTPGRDRPEELTVLAGVPEGAAAVPVLDFLSRLKASDAPWTKRLRKVKLVPPDEAVLFLDDETPVRWGPVRVEDGTLARKAARLERVLGDEILRDGAAYVRFVSDDRLAVKPLNAPGGGKNAGPR